MRRDIFKWVLASLILGVAFQAHARQAQFKDPEPIIFAQPLDLAKLDQAIDDALLRKNWVKKKIISETPRIFEIEYTVRTHKIMMKLEYDITKAQLSYANSENLNYEVKKGVQYIHPSYMVWTQQLADQIKSSSQITDQLATTPASTLPKGKSPLHVPTEALANFSAFKLEKTTISKKYQSGSVNNSTATNLDHNLSQRLTPIFVSWNKTGKPGRTLVIKPNIEAVRFVAPGARVFVGRMAGNSWLYLKLNLVDEATGALIAQPELYRLALPANGFTGSRRDFKMVEDMAADIETYLTDNYKTAVGGGTVPPAEIKAEAAL